jgi:hypothetical protein
MSEQETLLYPEVMMMMMRRAAEENSDIHIYTHYLSQSSATFS